MPVKRVELAPTRHPLGMLIKAKVLHICGNLHSFFLGFTHECELPTDPPLHSAKTRQWGVGGRGGGGGCLLLFEKLFLGHVIRQPATRCCHS